MPSSLERHSSSTSVNDPFVRAGFSFLEWLKTMMKYFSFPRTHGMHICQNLHTDRVLRFGV